MKLVKYQGAGNDFLIVDNRSGEVRLSVADIKQLCDRHFGFGADGLMLLNRAESPYDFSMEYFNSDGSGGMLCGNGARCIVAFARDLGLDSFHFLASDGPHEATIVTEEGRGKIVRLKMGNVDAVERLAPSDFFLNTGTRHFVRLFNRFTPIDKEAANIRHQPRFLPEGVNVNYVYWDGEYLHVNTFEKGVEGETLACGTGVVASAIVAHNCLKLPGTEIDVATRGGNFKVEFKEEGGQYSEVYLTGPTHYIGTLLTDPI